MRSQSSCVWSLLCKVCLPNPEPVWFRCRGASYATGFLASALLSSKCYIHMWGELQSVQAMLRQDLDAAYMCNESCVNRVEREVDRIDNYNYMFFLWREDVIYRSRTPMPIISQDSPPILREYVSFTYLSSSKSPVDINVTIFSSYHSSANLVQIIFV